MIQAGLRNLLITDSGINAVISSRVYPVRPPQGTTLPCVVYLMTSTDYPDGLDLDGSTAESQGPDTARFQLTCLTAGADGYSDVWTLANLLITKLRNHSGVMGSGTSRKCKYIRVEDARDEEIFAEDAADLHLFAVAVDIVIVYEPSEA